MPLFKITAPSLQIRFKMKGVFNQTNIGVGSRAMDVSAMHSANRIVGNPTIRL
jgi:allophanate hydrolase subunit 2